jgi:heme exporter protein D
VIWNSAADFFAMGGYGLYVWGAYAVTAIAMLGEPVLVARRLAAARRQARAAHDEPALDLAPRGSAS